MPLSQAEQTKYKSLYLQTARQYVTEMKENLNQLGTGNTTDDVIDSLHREAHSLTGQSAMMDYQRMNSVTSLLEKIFKAKKDKKLELADDLLAKLVEAVNELEKCLDSIDTTDKEIDMSQNIENLQKFAKV
jgi:chemotaxis protein histidine kinase CheA